MTAKKKAKGTKSLLRAAAVLCASTAMLGLVVGGVRQNGVFADELTNGTRNLETGYVDCNDGYVWDEAIQTCVVKTESDITCEEGYVLSQDGQRCVAPTVIVLD